MFLLLLLLAKSQTQPAKVLHRLSCVEQSVAVFFCFPFCVSTLSIAVYECSTCQFELQPSASAVSESAGMGRIL